MKNWTTMMLVMNIFMFLNTSNMIMFWILLEVNMLIFMMMNLEEKSKSETNLYYFMIQTLGSFMFLMSCCFKDFMSIWWTEELMILSMVLKLGLFPFHSWMFNLGKFLEKKMFLMILTIQKIPTMYFLINLNIKMNLLILTLNILVSTILILKSKNMKDLFISSSIFSAFWVMLMNLKSPIMFFIYYINYLVFLSFLMSIKNKSEKIKKIISLMFFMGLPPMGMFFMKIEVMNEIREFSSSNLFFLIWISTFLSLVAYFKFLYNMLLEKKMKYNLKKKMKLNQVIIPMITVIMLI